MKTQYIAKYSGVAIALHWIIALGIIVNAALPWIWEVAGDENVRPLIDTHKSIGVTILGLAIMRLLWRLTHRAPALPAGYKPWEVTASHVAHWSLYALLFAMPLSGWIMDSAYKDAASHPMLWFGLFEWPRIGPILHLELPLKTSIHDSFAVVHTALSYGLYVLFVLHVGGALKHQWLDGEAELQRMMP
jgi:cytochrome b561